MGPQMMPGPAAYGFQPGTPMWQDVGIQGDLARMNAQKNSQMDLAAQGFQYQGGQNALDRALSQSQLGQNLGFQGTQAGLNRDFQGTQAGLNRDLTSSQNALDRSLQQALQGNQLGFQGTQAGLDRQQQLTVLGQQQGFQGNQSALDRALSQTLQGNQLGFQGTQAGLDRTQQTALQNSALANQRAIAEMPIDFANRKFNALMPMISGAIGGIGGGGGGMGGGGGGGGGAVMGGGAGTYGGGGGGGHGGMGGAPGNVFTPDQINQQVNSAKAGNEVKSGTLQRQNANQNAAGGFGSNSPLLQALNNQTQLQTMGANQDAERQTRFAGAEANAKQATAGAQERDNAAAQFQANDINRQGNLLQSRSSLIAALAGMI